MLSEFQCSASFMVNYVAGAPRGGSGGPGDLDPDAESAGIVLRDGSTVTTREDQITFTKIFLYTTGSAPDGTSPNYGFNLDVTGKYASAVSTTYLFRPSTPNIDKNVMEPKFGDVEITMELDRTEAERIAGGPTGTADVTVIVKINTGTP